VKEARSNLWTAVLAAGICFILILAISALSANPSTDTVLRRPSTFFTDASGGRAIYLVLQRALPSVGQWRLPLTELKRPSRTGFASLIVMHPDTMGQDEARALDEWIRSGGQLILASNTDWIIQSSAKSPVPNFLDRHAIHAGPGAGRGTESAAITSVGKGRIVFVADDHAFSNSSLSKTDNAVWLAQRCSEWGGGALFDEYHLGFASQRGLISLMAMFSATPWGLMCAQLSLAGLIYIFGCRRRFGAPIDELPVERTNPVDTVQALGGLFSAARARILAATIMQQYLNAHVSTILRQRIDLMDAAVRERLAGPLGIERADLDSYAQAAKAAASTQVLSDTDFVQFGQKAATIARSFTDGLARGRRSGTAG
jgi:hypothetical protein